MKGNKLGKSQSIEFHIDLIPGVYYFIMLGDICLLQSKPT